MKNIYDKQLLELGYKYFLILKQDSEYKKDYLAYKRFIKEDKIFWKTNPNLEKQEIDKRCRISMDKFVNFISKWKLYSILNPSLPLRENNLSKKTFRPASSLAKFIYALGLDKNPELINPKKQQNKVSNRTSDLDKQIKKVLCYALCEVAKKVNKKTRYRQLGRIFGIDKDTAKRWIQEFNQLSINDKHIWIEEALRSYKFPDKDVLDLHHSKLQDLSNLIYSIDEKGQVMRDGRKRQPRDYYKELYLTS